MSSFNNSGNGEGYQHQGAMKFDLRTGKQIGDSESFNSTSKNDASQGSDYGNVNQINDRIEESLTQKEQPIPKQSKVYQEYAQQSNARQNDSIYATYEHEGAKEFKNLDKSKIRIVDMDEAAADASTTIPVESEDIESEAEVNTKPSSVFKSPMFWLIGLLMGFIMLQSYYFISVAWQSNPIIGGVWTLILGIILVFLLVTVYQELSSLIKLNAVELKRCEALEIIERNDTKAAILLCESLAKSSNVLKTKEYDLFKKSVQSHFRAEEIFAIYARLVLQAQDKKVRSIIVKRARETGVVVALSPLAWVDMLFTLARSLRLIREISTVYGVRCGYWARIKLYRKVMQNLVFIGVADLATDALVDVFGSSITTKLSANLGQGVAAAIYSSRLGYMTVKAVRPIPIDKEIFSLGKLRKDILLEGNLAKLLEDSVGNKNNK